VITEFEWNHHFADVQNKGPFKSFHHRHELRAETQNGVNGTVVRDVIEYDVGFGWLGQVAQKFFVSPQLQRTFEYRQKALENLLG
jgi:ligand-binding SRPBCC domain-containing protein